MRDSRAALSIERIESQILFIRGVRVMLDSDLAALYGVPTHRLNEAVKRNRRRFPEDFMFRLAPDEWRGLISQIAISKSGGRGGRRNLPLVFTEQGVAMLSSVLNSERAVRVNIEIMRAFVRLRHVLAQNRELGRRLDDVEKRVGSHDEQFVALVQAIRQLMEPPAAPKRKQIGFCPTY